jgi:hypothetical protein
MNLRCTSKLLDILEPAEARNAKEVVPPTEQDWYANVVWIERRKCILLTHACTLFSAFAADIRVAQLRPIGSFAVALIERQLAMEELPFDLFGQLDPRGVRVLKTASRSVLGCMNDMTYSCSYAVADSGGIDLLDVDALNYELHRGIHGPIRGMKPIEAALQRKLD